MKKILLFLMLVCGFASFGQLTNQNVLDTINAKLPDNRSRRIDEKALKSTFKTILDYTNQTAGNIDFSNYVNRTTAQSISGRKDFQDWVTFGKGDDGNGNSSSIFFARGPGDYSSSIGVNGNYDFFLYNQSGNFSGTKDVHLRIGSLAGDIIFNRPDYFPEFMRIKQNGNVLIGTSVDAGHKLDVNGTIRSTNSAIFASNSGTMGVGTSSNFYKLEVNGGARMRTYSGTDVNDAGIILNSLSSSDPSIRFAGIVIDPNGANGTGSDYGILRMYGTGHMDLINTFTGGNLNLVTSGLGRIRITGTGNTIISSTDYTDNNSSILTIASTTKGFLPPRMLEAQRNAIVSPSIGLMIYQTDGTEGMYIRKSTGWIFAY